MKLIHLYVFVIVVCLICELCYSGKMKDKMKKGMKKVKKTVKKMKKGCYIKQKITAITIPKYEYVDIPLAEEIPMLNMGKMNKVSVSKFKKKYSSGYDWKK